MNFIKTEQLTPGMRFSRDVFVEGNNILVPEGIPLKQKDLERLAQWGILEVRTEGEIITNNNSLSTNVITELLNKSLPEEIVHGYLSAVKGLDDIFNDIKKEKTINLSRIDYIVNNLLQFMHEQRDELISLVLQGAWMDMPLAKSSVNCLILSVVVGEHFNLPVHRIMHLAIGALLHDVGMMRVPEPIVTKKEYLSEEEKKILFQHPSYSYKIITKDLGYPEEIGLVALQHHERWDGKGYPHQLAKKAIKLGARIVSVADAFEAMVRDRPYRNSMVGYIAMRQLLNDNSRRFDSEVLNYFLKSMGIYPIGSLVILNNAIIGEVISVHSDAPLRPVIKVVINSQGRKLLGKKDETIDLIEERDLFIARALKPEEINRI